MANRLLAEQSQALSIHLTTSWEDRAETSNTSLDLSKVNVIVGLDVNEPSMLRSDRSERKSF